MKSLATLLSFSLLFVLTSHAQDKNYTFKGQVHAYGATLKDAKIEVYDGGDLVYESTTKGSGKFEFDLKAERQYMVEISKENLRTKTIWINTKGTQVLKFKVPAFAFDVYLKKDKVTKFDELSEIPVTLIKYQPEKKVFYMDKTYEEAVKNKKRRIKEGGLQMR